MFQLSFEVNWLNPVAMDFGGPLCGLSHVLPQISLACWSQIPVIDLVNFWENISVLKQQPCLNNLCFLWGIGYTV